MRGSLQTKVFAFVALGVIALVLGLTTFFSRRQEADTRNELGERLRLYVALASRELEPAVVADDERAAREAFDTLAVNEELSAIAVYRPDGSLLASRGDLGRDSVERATKTIGADHGVVVLELSTRVRDAEISAAASSAVSVGIVGLVLGLGAAWVLARHLGNRIGALAAAASKIAASDATGVAPLVVDDTDEIGRLSGSFNTMVDRLLAAQSKEIELLLTHVAKGFVIVDRAGKMGARHSSVMDRWFGDEVKPGATFWSLFRDDGNAAGHLELAWEGLFEEFLPIEVALDQFPKHVRRGDQTFELTIHPVRDDEGALTSALVTLVDVTDVLRREEDDATRSDLVALCERALVDRSYVVDFVTEGDSLLRTVEIGETFTLARAVHTLKGVAAQAGAMHISRLCNAIEQSMESSEDGAPKPAEVAALSARWDTLTTRLRTLFANAEPKLHASRADIEAVLASVDSADPVARKLRTLLLEPMDLRLERVKDGARTLARSLGKDVEVTGSAHGLRCDPAVWTPFWSALTHVVRNALDHGIESADVRAARGKRVTGRVAIDVMRRRDEVIVEVADDGAGIDWSALAAKARISGLPAETRGDLEGALFADGISTLDLAGEVSGRGIGLGAIHALTEEMGGRIDVASAPGEGTTLKLSFPAAMLGVSNRPQESGAWAVTSIAQ